MELLRSLFGRFTLSPTSDASKNWPLAAHVYPRSRQDIDAVLYWLKVAGGAHQLPTELLKLIMSLADYDRIVFSRTASHHESRRVEYHTKWSSSEAYLETPPIDFLHQDDPEEDVVDAGQLRPQNTGRLRRVRLSVTGRDQGWVSDRNAGSWSWFEIGRRGPNETEIQQRCLFTHNALASHEWQTHEFVYDVEEMTTEEAPESSELTGLLRDLKNGDRLSIIPVARFGGWQCNVQRAEIEIEVEMWY